MSSGKYHYFNSHPHHFSCVEAPRPEQKRVHLVQFKVVVAPDAFGISNQIHSSLRLLLPAPVSRDHTSLSVGREPAQIQRRGSSILPPLKRLCTHVG